MVARINMLEPNYSHRAPVRKGIIRAVMFVLCLFVGLPVASAEEPIDADLKAALGLAMSEDNQPFEDKIKDLLFVTTDDVHRSGFGERELDIEKRRKYFTENGWDDYQGFLLALKAALKEESKEPLNAHANFDGTQSYKIQSEGPSVFDAKGQISYARYDAYNPLMNFDIHISYSIEDKKNISSLLIDQWKIRFHYLPKVSK